MKNFASRLLLATAMMLTSRGDAMEGIATQTKTDVFDTLKNLDCRYLFTSENCNSLTKLDLQMIDGTVGESKPLTKTKLLIPLITEEKEENIFGIEYMLKSKPPVKVEEKSIASFVCNFKVYCLSPTCVIACTAQAPLVDMSCLYKNNQFILEAYFNHIDTRYYTKYVTDMHDMFFMCQRVEKIDLSNVDTSNVTNMDNMFRDCISLKEINVSGFNTSKVTSMKSMFAFCQSLEKLDISSFDMSNVTSCNYMFFNCNALNVLCLPASEKPGLHIKAEDYNGCTTLTTIIFKRHSSI